MKTLLELKTLLAAVNGKCVLERTECCFTKVATDSRNVSENTLFVPLVGEFQDGHKYIPSAVESGATVVFLNDSEYEKKPDFYKELAEKNEKVAFICVENTLHALQKAAEAYVSQVAGNMIRISITGSSGKTTTKEMMVSVAKKHFGADGVAYTKGNFNSETGLPLSVFTIRGDEKVCIFEMGMNRENEIGEISAVLKSKYGIITNIGNAHIGILGSRENIAREKRKSFDYIPADGAVCVPVNDDFADFCTEKVLGKVIKYGKTVDESVSGVKFIDDFGLEGTKFSIDGVEITLPLSGEYNYQNALGVIGIAKELGITAEEIKAGLEGMAAVNGRMETKKIQLKSEKTAVLIADCYNANPDSMKKVIDFCGTLKAEGRKVYVLGDMKELGSAAVSAHQEVAVAVFESKPAFVIFVGPEMKAAYEKLSQLAKNNIQIEYFEKNDEKFYSLAAEKIISFVQNDDVVLLKGSHSMALEKIIPLIEKEGGE